MPAETRGPLILFIDDDEDLVAALSIVLQRAGYRVRHAPDGEVGVRMALRYRPDLILLDFMMPVKDGFEACSELRATPALRLVPILALTSFGQDIGEIHGLARDADGTPHFRECLEKPIEPNVLLDRIASALDHRARGRGPADQPGASAGG